MCSFWCHSVTLHSLQATQKTLEDNLRHFSTVAGDLEKSHQQLKLEVFIYTYLYNITYTQTFYTAIIIISYSLQHFRACETYRVYNLILHLSAFIYLLYILHTYAFTINTQVAQGQGKVQNAIQRYGNVQSSLSSLQQVHKRMRTFAA